MVGDGEGEVDETVTSALPFGARPCYNPTRRITTNEEGVAPLPAAEHIDVNYRVGRHSAVRTDAFVFNQLIPYIGNKRKLLPLIHEAISSTETQPGDVFLDLFAGSGVVSRLAKVMGLRLVSNDWEPYTAPINGCYVACNQAPAFPQFGGYERAISILNNLPPVVGWVTEHLCPRDDAAFDVRRDRMFYTRRNGMRIDAMREQILSWQASGALSEAEKACLLAPLLYQVCYTSNTSGVFKGFHNGWGGPAGTALYRIASDLQLQPAVFFDNGEGNEVLCNDAQACADYLASQEVAVAYLDPPYNQHPYGSNYHVLNTVTLWDEPPLSREITRGTKSAIRTDWRTLRRSPYNYRDEATKAYRRLVHSLNARYILTSYSTDGFIPMRALIAANAERGHVSVLSKPYKRYRVSSTRFSLKPMNVEFVIVLDTHREGSVSVEELERGVLDSEQGAIAAHPETRASDATQPVLF